MFVHGISSSYLSDFSDKYFEMSYPMDKLITNICNWDILGISLFHSSTGPVALGALLLLWTRVAMAFFVVPFTTAISRCSVAATDRPPKRGLPRPNCHSHWFTT